MEVQTIASALPFKRHLLNSSDILAKGSSKGSINNLAIKCSTITVRPRPSLNALTPVPGVPFGKFSGRKRRGSLSK